ncbi:MAG TPA: phosphotransferase [Microlunatus sp.]
MILDRQWQRFLRARGVDPTGATLRRLDGGEINDNWLVRTGNGAWVLRHYLRTSDAAELDCELSAVDQLGRAGFPTPAPIPGAETDHRRRLWEPIDGTPAALFPFIRGDHPQERSGGYGSLDRRLAERAARLAARMHTTLAGKALTGRRAPSRDPWRQIAAFLDSDLAGHRLFAELITPMAQVRERLAQVYSRPDDLPSGLIHNDIRPPNLLLEDGEIVALLDFDDSAQTFLAYELGALVSNFGKDQDRRVELDRVLELITAYDAERPLTAAERAVLPELLTAHAGSDAIRVIAHWIADGHDAVDTLDSYSARELLDLANLSEALHTELGE